MKAYDDSDYAYANGTIQEAEAAVLRFRESSFRALETNANYVDGRKTLWLSNMRLFSIYKEMQEDVKAQQHLKESYDYSDEKEEGMEFEVYSNKAIDFVMALDGEIQPKWRVSNEAVHSTPDSRSAPYGRE